MLAQLSHDEAQLEKAPINPEIARLDNPYNRHNRHNRYNRHDRHGRHNPDNRHGPPVWVPIVMIRIRETSPIFRAFVCFWSLGVYS